MWKDLSLEDKSNIMPLFIKKGIYRLSDIEKLYNQFAEGGDTNPMGYEHQGTVYDDSLKKQGITHLAELPEVTVTGSKPWWQRDIKSAFEGYTEYLPDLVSLVPGAGDIQDVYNAAKDVYNGNYTQAGILGASLLLPNALEKPAKFLANKVGKLSQSLLDRGWKIAEDGFAVSPEGKRFVRNHEGRLVSEQSFMEEMAAKESRQKNVLAPIASKKEAEKKALNMYDKFDDMGMDSFREQIWFQGRPSNGKGAVSEEDLNTWRSHLPEYMKKAKEFKKNGALYQDEQGVWFGKFANGDIQVDPAEYVVAHSDAFKNAGLVYDGSNRMSAMTSHAYNSFLDNGGIGVTTWTTNSAPQALLFQKERTPGRLVSSLVSKNAPTQSIPKQYAKEAREVANGIQTSSNVDYRNTIGDYTLFGQDMQMKVLRGNNGDFNMKHRNIYKGLVPFALGTTSLGLLKDNE